MKEQPPAIGMMPEHITPLRQDVIFDRPTAVQPAHDISARVTAEEWRTDDRLMIGARVVAAVQQAVGPNSAKTLIAGSSSYES